MYGQKSAWDDFPFKYFSFSLFITSWCFFPFCFFFFFLFSSLYSVFGCIIHQCVCPNTSSSFFGSSLFFPGVLKGLKFSRRLLLDGSGGETLRSGQARHTGGWSLHIKHPQAGDVEAGEGEHPASWLQAEEGVWARGGSFLPSGFTTKPSPFTQFAQSL